MQSTVLVNNFSNVIFQERQVDGLLSDAVRRNCYNAVNLLLDFADAVRDSGAADDVIENCKPAKTRSCQGLILAAQAGNVALIRLFLSRGYIIHTPHDLDCPCTKCLTDPLGQAKARIETLSAISNPIWIALTADDPFLTIFKLCKASKTFGKQEDCFEKIFHELTLKQKHFCLQLLDQIESKEEELVIMNFGEVKPDFSDGDDWDLKFIKLAIEYNQKEVVSHPIPQHVITSIVFDNIPKWRTSGLLYRTLYITITAVLFPVTSMMHILCPCSPIGKSARKPLIKFINGAASFVTLLALLAITATMPKAGLRAGYTPTVVEAVLFIWIVGLFVQEFLQLLSEGQREYFSSGWNWIDISMIFLMLISYVLWGALYFVNPGQKKDGYSNLHSLADGSFALGIVLSFFRMVYLCQITRYLGLLQLCLGRMVQVIFQFAFISCVVLWSFSVGMVFLFHSSALYEKEVQKWDERSGNSSSIDMVLSGGYNGLPATMVTLAWASMNMVGLKSLDGFDDGTMIHLWSAVLFTLYHGVAMIVLLNMLIAMMSNSYQQIENNIEVEHKFARTKLWCQYVGDDNNVLPCPFNILPSIEMIQRIKRTLLKSRRNSSGNSEERKTVEDNHKHKTLDSFTAEVFKGDDESKQRYQHVCKRLLNRYLKKNHGIFLNDSNINAISPENELFLKNVHERIEEWSKALLRDDSEKDENHLENNEKQLYVVET